MWSPVQLVLILLALYRRHCGGRLPLTALIDRHLKSNGGVGAYRYPHHHAMLDPPGQKGTSTPHIPTARSSPTQIRYDDHRPSSSRVVDGANTCPPRARSSPLPALAGEQVGTATSEAHPVAHELGVADLSAPHADGTLSHIDVGCAMFGQVPLLPTGGLCESDYATTRWFGGVAHREPRSTVTATRNSEVGLHPSRVPPTRTMRAQRSRPTRPRTPVSQHGSQLSAPRSQPGLGAEDGNEKR
ncbi:hypothetical protein FISHEDRAFT_70416 [Fistulina hepatica ATCC 64428]|uniref:Secreted protein n=1 Tax=Fistulina hepatica ATCC 64428 TaxID=1128425 RepID=A0A0D7AK14_9AGAR|nr:hypothetical protein FISHEDRAFT_70416 [Fistulina hepatica ATCC 64428]